MSNDKDLTTEVAKEIAKQLPLKEAYRDLLAPGTKQTGALVEDVIKTLRLALAPLQFTSALQDRYARFLNESIRRVPADKLTSPPPQILGPVIEGIRYEPENTPISEMFSELLSKAFDGTEVSKAHPSYPAIIRQLSSDEALLLRMLWQNRSGPPIKRQYTLDLSADMKRFSNRVIEVEVSAAAVVAFPSNIDFYIDRLHNLGLANLFSESSEPIHGPDSKQIGTRQFLTLKLTPMGERFMEAVSSISTKP
jgi:hypothetical protein